MKDRWAIKKLTGLFCAFAAIVFLAIEVCKIYHGEIGGIVCNTFPSPDGHYKIITYAVGLPVLGMPGQGGDAPGCVTLYDASTGRRLECEWLDMVNMISKPDDIKWSATNVELGPIADWKLP